MTEANSPASPAFALSEQIDDNDEHRARWRAKALINSIECWGYHMAIRCLVAHESEYMCLMMSDILVKNGFDVVGNAMSGVEAVERYASLRPDILTLDFRLPDLDGMDAMREILRLDPGARVLMCSSVGEHTQMKDALSAGAQEILVKPFHEDRVIDAIKKSLR